MICLKVAKATSELLRLKNLVDLVKLVWVYLRALASLYSKSSTILLILWGLAILKWSSMATRWMLSHPSVSDESCRRSSSSPSLSPPWGVRASSLVTANLTFTAARRSLISSVRIFLARSGIRLSLSILFFSSSVLVISRTALAASLARTFSRRDCGKLLVVFEEVGLFSFSVSSSLTFSSRKLPASPIPALEASPWSPGKGRGISSMELHSSKEKSLCQAVSNESATVMGGTREARKVVC